MKYYVKLKPEINLIVDVTECACYTCKYCHLRASSKYYCFGEKEPPEVDPLDCCDNWRSKNEN